MSTTPPRPGSAEPISSASSISQEPINELERYETLEQNEEALPAAELATSSPDENTYLPNVGIGLVLETDVQAEDEQPVTTSVPKELSPVSPVPLHVPEPSKIPLLLDPALSRTIPNEEQIPLDIGSALSDPSLTGSNNLADEIENTAPEATLLGATATAVQAANAVGATDQFVYQPDPANQQIPSAIIQNALPEYINVNLATVDAVMTGMLPASSEAAIEPPSTLEMKDRDAISSPASAMQPVNLQALLANMVNQNQSVVNDTNAIESADPTSVAPDSQSNVASFAQQMVSPTSALPSAPFQPLKTSPHALPTVPGQVPPSISHPTNLRHPLPENPTTVAFTDGDEGEVTFSQEEERAYENFLNVERDYVAKGEWSRFPAGSRLFIGNLSSERISIKQAFGFVQFFDVNSCSKALREEQGTPVRGRQMHLEISKPQRNTGRNNEPQAKPRSGPVRRSRSPEEPISPRNRGSSYRGTGFGDRESRNSRDSGVRGRDEYRPNDRRMSSPRSQYGRDRDDYYPNRDYRDRSRSPRGRYRSPTPPHRGSFDRQRQPTQPVDALIVVFDDLDPGYIKYVDGVFRDRRLRTDVLHMTQPINLESHIKEQVVQGCQAVVFLTRATQGANKVSIQIFKGSSNNPGQYDEYDMINPDAAAELVRRACGSQQSQYSVPNGYANNQYQGQPPPPQSYIPSTQTPIYPANHPQQAPVISAPPLNPANLTGILQNLDPATLQTLLAQLQGQQPPQAAHASVQNPYMQAAPQMQKPADLSAMLGAVAGAQQQQTYTNLPSGIDYQNPALVGLLGGLNQRNSGSMQQPQTNQQVQNIMSQLTGQWSAGR
ncbi:hypothetical protein H072_10663 [Dactylellina haptotyla CBS 200.50]|uniref:RRM domain-containing protein n=1 Tax=Dactylellina haptotyla (strain CBS 200.50) TaxID=1284197 RepID=S7ZYS3_DACHA|nr:hypothetical protein H072_10663 [Dactylellina haptotyla CBS 200.50]